MVFKKVSPNSYEWTPFKTKCLSFDNAKYGVVLLNHGMDHLSGKRSEQFKTIWENATVRLSVDGGSNYLTTDYRRPDIISGDFDSISTEVLEHFRSLGTKIINTPDQNYTDFTKAIEVLINETKDIEFIVTFWSQCGRIDQLLSNVNTLYIFNGQSEQKCVPILLLQTEQSLSWLLDEGSHIIKSRHSSKWCSLVPIGSKCVITTSGLRWNLNNDALEFGKLISTSNEFDANEEFVRITTDKPLLFSMDISTVIDVK